MAEDLKKFRGPIDCAALLNPLSKIYIYTYTSIRTSVFHALSYPYSSPPSLITIIMFLQ